ncbi:hypothetical protein QOZ80_8BG0650860 [Eleusine coracana subsp. coracana]|nr:hypothetical protein QOZ80_8BG0650860 [Eleusine coracana subsp. coracana]
MPGDKDGPAAMSDSQKLDLLITQLSSVNNQIVAVNTRLDGHAQRLARTKQLAPGGQNSRFNGSSGSTNSVGEHRHTTKLNFPHFDGEVDPLPWINTCETYFRGMKTLEEEKVWTASLHLDGAAAEWFLALDRDNPGLT